MAMTSKLGLGTKEPAQPEKEERTIWEDGDSIGCERELLTLFAQNQIKVALALPLLAVLFALASLTWTTPFHAITWLVAAIGCQMIQVYLCKQYLQTPTNKIRYSDWIGMLSASEFLMAACWSLLVFILWDSANAFEHIYIIATLMAVIAIRIMIAGNFMPVIIAGTGFLTFNVAIRCIIEAQPLYIALGAMAIALEIFFIQISVRLQTVARDMLVFKAQKEKLIEELARQKDAADAARVEAEEANRAKSQFLATMSHELRTPLNAILGFSEILGREMFGPHRVEAYKNYATDIHNSGNYLLNLINDILDLSRIEAGRRDLEDAPVALAQSVAEAVHVLAERAAAKGLSVTTDIADDLPKVLADKRALQQIWLNLLSNAVKFTPKGGRIAVKAKHNSNGSISVSVIDTGPGIPPREVDIALRTYSRGAYATKKAIDGAGLGLPIVNGLVQLHGGEFRIVGSRSEGTEVTVTFPPKRVLDGPRGEILAAPTVKTASQRKLISLTG
ncbi:MAG: HAMP domain-containing histidine kinase [Rhizobiales bacterium]|nr:HAMP domain-containing histidine kinase [Hyphomicrobiales bacterium]